MPFTLSHPAAVLPFTRRGWSLSALVTGSMAPDFLYFLLLVPGTHFGHTLPGIFLFCLPAGWMALGLFHGLLKWPLLALLSPPHQARLLLPTRAFAVQSLAQLFSISSQMCLGTVTHIVWDSFTHEPGWSVQRLPFLLAPAVTFGTVSLPWCKLLQHLSTLAGGAVLFFRYRRWFQTAPETTTPGMLQLTLKQKFLTGVGIILFGSLGGVIFIWNKVPFGFDFRTLNIFLTRLGISSLSFSFVGLLLYSVGWHWFFRQSGQQTLDPASD
ncbi:MAG: DUF4184 family protein [Blastocatellia bacterium]|nr:DUF4184 family protein [Blastocatellia bacterium]